MKYTCFIPLLFVLSGVFAQQDCNNPKFIGSLPYGQYGVNPTGVGDDYDLRLICTGTSVAGEDFVYRIKPTTNVIIDIRILNIVGDPGPGIYLTEGCPSLGNCVGYSWDDLYYTELYLSQQLLLKDKEYFITLDGPNITNFDIEIEENNFVNCPVNYSPVDGSMAVTSNILSWENNPLGLPADSFKVHFGTSSNPPVYAVTMDTFIQIPFNSGGTQYWKVKSYAAGIQSSGCGNQSFQFDFSAVGVNTNNPEARLHVIGQSGQDPLRIENAAGEILKISDNETVQIGNPSLTNNPKGISIQGNIQSNTLAGGSNKPVFADAQGKLVSGASSGTSWLNFHPYSFVPDDENEEVVKDGYVVQGTPGDYKLILPLQLPDGANLTGVQFQYIDNNDIWVFKLVRTNISNQSTLDLATHSSTFGGLSSTLQTHLQSFSHTVNNEIYLYHISVENTLDFPSTYNYGFGPVFIRMN